MGKRTRKSARQPTPSSSATRSPSSRSAKWVLGLGAIVLGGLAVFTVTYLAVRQAAAPKVVSRSVGTTTAFVDNASCVQCHTVQARAWSGSHHAKAMARATPEAVLGDFGDVTFDGKGVVSRFFRRGELFFVNTEGPDGKPADFEIAYTLGVDPLQQYLIALPGGRLQALTVAWDVKERRWFDLLPGERTPPGDLLHWTGRGYTANTMCIACHTTGFEKRYDQRSDTFTSRWSEINVSCQSCHGPGAAHVNWAKGNRGDDRGGSRYGLAADLKAMDPHRQIEVCAMCHSRRSELTGTFDAGRPFMDQFLPSNLSAGLYHADGQQQDEVYAFGSFRQSKMYRLGVTCTDCHDPHTSRLKAEGNAVCTQCHSLPGDRRFPTAAKIYDDPTHHHHAIGSAGAQCASCHMPATTYMGVHQRPDHSLRIPRPDLAMKLGTPDACTGCHTDKSKRWAADAVDGWFGADRPRRADFAETLAAGRANRGDTGPRLARLADDPEMPAIVRASALDLLGGDGEVGASAAMAALGDADPAVRRAGVAALEGADASVRLAKVGPLLSDPVRAVRIEAARVLSSIPASSFDVTRRAAFDKALTELRTAQEIALDMPGSQLNLGVLTENQEQRIKAEGHYRAALKLDHDFTPARLNLARLLAGSGRPAEAERVLREGIARTPGQGDLSYSLGLLLAEQRRLAEAVVALTEASRLLSERARVHYNLALALQQSGRRTEAELAFLRAAGLAPADRSIAYALAVIYAQDRRWSLAVPWAEKLVTLDIRDPKARAFLEQLRENAERDRQR